MNIRLNLDADVIAGVTLAIVAAFMFVTIMWFPTVLLNVMMGLLTLILSLLIGFGASVGVYNLTVWLQKQNKVE